MRFLAILSCLVCVAAAGNLSAWLDKLRPAHDVNAAHTPPSVQQRQKFVLDVLLQVQRPPVNTRIIEMGRVLIEAPDMYDVESDAVLLEFIARCREHEVLGYSSVFSIVDEVHRQQFIGLYKFLVHARDWWTFQHNVCFARLHMNPVMFVNAFVWALRDRYDSQEIVVPALHEIMPHMYYDVDVIVAAANVDWRDLITKPKSRKPGLFDVLGVHWTRPGAVVVIEEPQQVWRVSLVDVEKPVHVDKEETLIVHVGPEDGTSSLVDDVGLNTFWQNVVIERLMQTYNKPLMTTEEVESLQLEPNEVWSQYLKVPAWGTFSEYSNQAYAKKVLEHHSRPADDGEGRVHVAYLQQKHNFGPAYETTKAESVKTAYGWVQKHDDESEPNGVYWPSKYEKVERQLGSALEHNTDNVQRVHWPAKYEQVENNDVHDILWPSRYDNLEKEHASKLSLEEKTKHHGLDWPSKYEKYEKIQSHDDDLHYQAVQWPSNYEQVEKYQARPLPRSSYRPSKHKQVETEIGVETEHSRLPTRNGELQYHGAHWPYRAKKSIVQQNEDRGIQHARYFWQQQPTYASAYPWEHIEVHVHGDSENRSMQDQKNAYNIPPKEQKSARNIPANDRIIDGDRLMSGTDEHAPRKPRSVDADTEKDFFSTAHIMSMRSGEVFLHNLKQLMAYMNMEKIALKWEKTNEVWDKEEVPTPVQLVTSNGAIYDGKILDDWTVKRAVEKTMGQVTKTIDSLLAQKRIPENSMEVMDAIGDFLVNDVDSNGINMWDTFYQQIVYDVYGYPEATEDIVRHRANMLTVPTAMLREPVYWTIVEELLKVVDHYTSHLEPYQTEHLSYEAVTVHDVEVDHFITYTDVYDSDLVNAVDQQLLLSNVNNIEKLQKKVVARQRRLNHQPFVLSYNIELTAPNAEHVVVRTFIGPRVDEDGHVVSITEQRHNFVLLDGFVQELQPGKNVFERSSHEISWTARDVSSLKEIYHQVVTGQPLKQLVSADCRFPHRLVLPRGALNGLPVQLLVVVTPVSTQDAPLHKWVNPHHLCGIGIAGIALDRLPLGYPLDKASVMVPVSNILQKNVIVKHELIA